MAAGEQVVSVVDGLVYVLTAPGRIAGETLDNVSSALRPDHTILESYEATDSAGTVALVAVAGVLVALLLYVWSR